MRFDTKYNVDDCVDFKTANNNEFLSTILTGVITTVGTFYDGNCTIITYSIGAPHFCTIVEQQIVGKTKTETRTTNKIESYGIIKTEQIY